MSRKRWAAIGLVSATVITVAAAGILTACDRGASDDTGRPATVTTASSSGNANALKKSGLAIGVGDQPGATMVTRPTPDQVTARCHGQADTLTIDITAPNGWRAVLKNTSQTITVENTTLKYPAADFTTPTGTIEASRKLAGSGFPLGVTWGRPGPGDVEVQLSEKAPASWTTTGADTDFTMFMHLTCS
ncbi:MULTISPECIES: hypothetical protein [unclassified Nocardia]|uniref:hypothetical protein n=1 Tax=unclassified Nocardia TaxID=2637762 RepID=UPI001CE4AA99|nr:MULTISPECIES: hypothetical protein [unclassified Nocardia]